RRDGRLFRARDAGRRDRADRGRRAPGGGPGGRAGPARPRPRRGGGGRRRAARAGRPAPAPRGPGRRARPGGRLRDARPDRRALVADARGTNRGTGTAPGPRPRRRLARGDPRRRRRPPVLGGGAGARQRGGDGGTRRPRRVVHRTPGAGGGDLRSPAPARHHRGGAGPGPRPLAVAGPDLPGRGSAAGRADPADRLPPRPRRLRPRAGGGGFPDLARRGMNAHEPARPLREALTAAALTVHDGDALPAGETAVVLLDSWTLASVTELAARARAAGSTLLPVRCDGALVLVGPLAGPDSAGCLACAERTRLDSLPGPVPAGAPQTMGGAAPPQAAGLAAALASAAVAAGTTGVLWALRGEDLEVSAHRVLPFGGCEVCAPLPQDAPRPVVAGRHPVTGSALREDNPRTETAAQLREVLVDWRLGPVQRLYRWEDRTLPLASARLTGSAGLIGTGYGRSEDFAEAERVALFEALERLTGMRPRGIVPEVYATHGGLDPGVAVDPAVLGLHEPDLERHPEFVLEPYAP